MISRVEVKGVDELAKNIENLKRGMLSELEDSADAGAQLTATIVRSRAPGSLREGVATKRLPRREGYPAVSLVGIKWFGYQQAHLVEFGTAGRYHKSGKYVGAMPANPFFRGSIDAARSAVKGSFVSGATKAIKGAGK